MNSIRFILLTAILLCASPLAVIGEDAGVSQYRIEKGLPFTSSVNKRKGDKLTLDLYLPRRQSKPSPCVMVIQGGGFRPQNGERFRPFAKYLAERGFAAALVSYRGQPDHQFLDTMADLKAAVRYVRKNAEKYQVDSKRIGAMGRSAGGTLAALLAVTGGVEQFEGSGGNGEQSSRIQAAVCFAGVFDFVSRFTDEEQVAMQPGHQEKRRTNGLWIGKPFSEKDSWLNASAVNHISDDDPPILFLHCKNDNVVPWLQSQQMYTEMKKATLHAELKVFESGRHGFGNLGDKPMAEMVRFFREKLSP